VPQNDGGYDGESSFDGNEFVDFTVNNDKKSGNSGRTLPFEESDSFRLSFCYCGRFYYKIRLIFVGRERNLFKII
jgi:hypothetical protein